MVNLFFHFYIIHLLAVYRLSTLSFNPTLSTFQLSIACVLLIHPDASPNIYPTSFPHQPPPHQGSTIPHTSTKPCNAIISLYKRFVFQFSTKKPPVFCSSGRITSILLFYSFPAVTAPRMQTITTTVIFGFPPHHRKMFSRAAPPMTVSSPAPHSL